MTAATHPLLARLLRRVGADREAPPSAETWRSLLALVSRTYHDADQDRYTLERSIEISSRELQGLYHDLKRSSEAVLRAMLESANAAILVVDQHHQVIAVNRQFGAMFAVPEATLAGADHATLVEYTLRAWADATAMRETIGEVLRSGGVHHAESALADGRIIDCYSAPIQLRDGGGSAGRVTFFRDITAERVLTQQLERAREAAEAASQAKTMFLASMSHELRTPLNAVIGLAELMAVDGPDPLSARQQEYVDGIVDAGRHLLALVNDVLDLAKVEAGKQDFFPEEVGACEAIEDAVSMLAPLAGRRGVHLDARLPATETYLLADPTRFRQILYNLISNAVKFTDRDRKVEVMAACEGDRIAIAVADQGIGIAPEDQERLFRAFEQIAASPTDRPPGTGLGLALTKRLVDMHGGTIEVASQLGAGTTFTVRIPLASEATR